MLMTLVLFIQTAPPVFQGKSILIPVSIRNYLENQTVHDAPDVHLGLEDDSDSEDDVPLDKLSASASSSIPKPHGISPPKASSSRKKMRNKMRSNDRRFKKRLMNQTSIKNICKKRVAQAKMDVLHLGFVMSSNESITQRGWVGKHNAKMPLKPFTLMEVVNDYGLTHFSWDGV